jgi:hypothetical protein
VQFSRAKSELSGRVSMLVRLIISGFVLVVFAFSGNAQSSSNVVNDQGSVPPDTVIKLIRDGLQIKIVADGTVYVEGMSFDFDLARLKLRISIEEVKNLLHAFERINYFSLNDRYHDKEDGCQRTRAVCTFIAITTSLTLNGKSKSVTRLPYQCLEEDGSSYPRQLVAIEKQIEETVDLKIR